MKKYSVNLFKVVGVFEVKLDAEDNEAAMQKALELFNNSGGEFFPHEVVLTTASYLEEPNEKTD